MVCLSNGVVVVLQGVKIPKKNPTSDPTSDKENFATLANANTKLRELLNQIHIT